MTPEIKIVIYERTVQNPLFPALSSTATCFYVPQEKVILYKLHAAVNTLPGYGLTREKEMLKDARELEKGNTPQQEGVRYSNRRETTSDAELVKAIIAGTESKKELEELITAGIEKLLRN